MSGPLDAVLEALEEVLTCFDPGRDRVTVVGGLAPTLLVPTPSGPAHVGTADVDLCLTVAVADGTATTGGADPVARLEAAGWTRTRDPRRAFRWRRGALAVDFLYPAGPGEAPVRTLRDPVPALAGLAALSVPCRHLVEALRVRVELPAGASPGDRDPGWAYVSGPAAFAAMKGYALERREQHKDAYDVVWLLDAVGPEAAGADAARVAADDPAVARELADAVDTLAHLFQPGHVGPAWYAAFLDDGGDPATHDRHERVAVDTVARFLEAARPR